MTNIDSRPRVADEIPNNFIAWIPCSAFKRLAEIIEIRVPLETPRNQSKRSADGNLNSIPFVFHLPHDHSNIRGVYFNPM